MIQIKELESYKNYGRVLSIANGVIECFVTLDCGPRVIRFSFVGEKNIFNSTREELGVLGGDDFENFFGKDKKWHSYGGHRIWTSPESFPETYYPDNDPVEYQKTESGAIFTPPAETENGVQKSLEIKMDADDANMQVIMNVKNITDKPMEFSIWGISVCDKDGTLFVPMNDNDTGLLHNRNISVWSYTDLSDKRIKFGKKYAIIKQERDGEPLKLGFDISKGKAYYKLGDKLFLKTFNANHGTAVYPDGNCSFESYTSQNFLEVESLGELKEVLPGETSTNCEGWSLFRVDENAPVCCDDCIEALLEKL